jgi:hypothetical protein
VNTATETERVRSVQDKQAAKYDRQISFFERILFGDGRAWVCSQRPRRRRSASCARVVSYCYWSTCAARFRS